MQITHEQARKLIQFSLDGLLPSPDKAMLSAHLHDCSDCQAYANEIKEVENLLFSTMKRQWSLRPVPLSITALIGKKRKIQSSTFLAIRSAAIIFFFFALFFSIWQFASSGPAIPGTVPLVVPSVPTPSAQTAQSTSTKLTAETCEMIMYSVQENDTLASIANRFLVAEDEIMEINHLKTDSVSISMELLITVCN